MALLSILAAGARSPRNLGGERRAGAGGSWQKPCSELAPATLQEGSQQSECVTILLPFPLRELLIGNAHQTSEATGTFGIIYQVGLWGQSRMGKGREWIWKDKWKRSAKSPTSREGEGAVMSHCDF